MISTIIHQTWKTAELPEEFQVFQQTWRRHHPLWEYRLWSDADNLDFLERHCPDFLPVYKAYSSPVSRVDAIRYFLLKHYGGMYVDLDFECLRPLDSLLSGKEVVLGLEPPSHVQQHHAATGLSFIVCNAFMASRPQHPFWDHVIERLFIESINQDPLDATGPFFLTRALLSYGGREQISVLPSDSLYPADANDCEEGRLFDLEYWWYRTGRAYAIHHWSGTWWHASTVGRRLLPSAEARARLMIQGRVVADSMLHARQAAVVPPQYLVSCLMVTQNRASQAICAIRCFQNQTYPERELIILDDGDDDRLAVWVAAQDDARIRYYRLQPQTGALGALRNRAVALAKGEYLCQWDDDDLYDPARIETQLSLMRALGADACLLSRWLIWWPSRERFSVSASRPWEGSILCAKGILPSYPDDLRRGEDTVVTDELLQSARVLLLDQPRLYLYVVHGSNTFEDEHFDQHWQSSGLRFEGWAYEHVSQEISKRMDLERYRLAIAPQRLATPLAVVADTACLPSLGPSKISESVSVPEASSGQPTRPAIVNEWPPILVLTPIKNAARFIPNFFGNLLRLDYPRAKLSLAFLEGDSEDDTWETLREYSARYAGQFARIDRGQLHFGLHIVAERWAPDVQFQRRTVLAKCRNRLFQNAYRQEAWVLWLDADVIDYPMDVLHRLLSTNKSIVVPHCVRSRGGPSFDLNTFKYRPGFQAQSWRHAVDGIIQPAPGVGRLYLDALRGQEQVEVDSVGGTMLLVRADLHAEGLLFPDFSYRGYLETEGFAMRARDRGIVSWGMPDLEILHALD